MRLRGNRLPGCKGAVSGAKQGCQLQAFLLPRR
jgi:hypothetical protein